MGSKTTNDNRNRNKIGLQFKYQHQLISDDTIKKYILHPDFLDKDVEGKNGGRALAMTNGEAKISFLIVSLSQFPQGLKGFKICTSPKGKHCQS